jgi:hypothetical protein
MKTVFILFVNIVTLLGVQFVPRSRFQDVLRKIDRLACKPRAIYFHAVICESARFGSGLGLRR